MFKISIFYCLICFVLISSCNEGSKKNLPQQAQPKDSSELHKKPASTFQDTLYVNSKSVVFYQPDSIQLESIKAVTDPSVFDGSMHEYFYQIRNAHIVLKQNWSQLKIIDSKNVRYLVFVGIDNTIYTIDLDQYNDAYGMFVFNLKKAPILVEMTNLESIIQMYLSS